MKGVRKVEEWHPVANKPKQSKAPPTMRSTELDYKTLFANLPGPYIVFQANDPEFVILAENQAHADMAMSSPQNSIGKPLFEIFPDTSEKYIESGESDLLESLRTVIRSGQPDTMETFRYDLRRADGSFEERYWRVTHYPLFDAKTTVFAVCQATTDVTQEVSTEQHLKQTEIQLDDALSIGRVGSWVWDIPQDKIRADQNLARLFGVSTKEAAQGLPLKIFTNSIHPDDKSRIIKAIARAVKRRDTFEEEYRTISTGGIMRWVIARGRIETDSKHKAVRFPGVIVDITERKEAEAKFRQQLDFTNSITQSLGEGVYAIDNQGKLTFMNPAAERMLGWSQAELLGKRTHSIIHFQKADGTLVPAQKCPLISALKTGRPSLHDNETLTRKDGTMFTVSLNVVPIKQGRTIIGAVQSFNDVTERRQSEINLRFLADASTTLASSLDYKKTLRTIAKLGVPQIADWCAIDLLDREKNLQQVAVAHKDPKQVAWAKAERAKQPPKMDAPNGVPNVLRTGKGEFYPVITDEMLLAGAKGNKAQMERLKRLKFRSVMIVPLKLQRETVGAITFVSTDQGRHFSKADFQMAQELGNRASMAMTNARLYQTVRNELVERERLEEELRLVNEELEQRVNLRTAELQTANTGLQRSNQELQDFAYVASHDLQEPLRKIQAFANLLSSEYAAKLGDGRDYLDRMKNAAARMSTLIEDLLSFSRVTTQGRPFESIDLADIVHDVLEDLETRLEDTGGTITVGKLPTITADPMQMRQLFQNLISNALKFSSIGTKPVVSVWTDSIKTKSGKIKAHVLHVADNGIGFEEKYLDRIFAVFQRLHGRETYQGTGIGLAICRKIAERHGGEITARSKPGKGAEFIITLPVKPVIKSQGEQQP